MGSSSEKCGNGERGEQHGQTARRGGPQPLPAPPYDSAGTCPLGREPAAERLTVRSANARSRAEWKRRSGSFSRQCATIWRSAGATVSGNSGGSSRRMAVITSTPVGRSNGGPSGEAFVEHQAEAEDIAARVHDFAAHLFGRHVTGGPEHGARHGARERLRLIAARRTARHLFGQSEIEDLGAPVAREHDVLRLEIAVYDGLRVSRRQRFGHLYGDLHHAALRQGAAFQQVAQGLAFDQFADDVDQPILAADIVIPK